MPKTRTRYVCQSCGEAFLRWEGQCRACGGWNTLVETVVREPDARAARPAGAAGPATSHPLAGPDTGPPVRRPVGIREVDRVLGGGLVPGAVVLVGGEPGIGKSTLLLQVAGSVAEGSTGGVLYASGEESIQQVRLRAGRLGLTDAAAGVRIRLLAENEVGSIADRAREERPDLLIVDSIQTLVTSELDGPAGTVGQVREAAARLIDLAKGEGIPVILVGHVTKDGTLAGPKTLEHLVDVVLAIEGERTGGLRLLRAQKNRYGSTEEIGVFEMGERGLAEVADPGRAFLGEHDGPAPGSVVAPTLEGSRPILVEVQALVAPTTYPSPRRTASGFDANRLALLVAVLGRRAGIGLGSHDVYANLAGGLALSDPGLDLPVGLALASSLRDRPVSPAAVAIGEVGLLGELRPVGGLDRRLKEAARLGFARAIVPRAARSAPRADGIEIVPASTLAEAIELALEPPAPRRGERVVATGRC
ncbi:MAG TPA: DNA repair protein RadA [Candidatus Limnocylindrales bacterium]|nr:DNA repair protein RadA [Candidatus Limnocylindrales bacterium]